MRFNNRSCALLGIPDLPLGAFEHVGNGKIKPQGGGGSWDPGEVVDDTVSSVTDVVSDAGQAVSDVVTDTLDKADNWTEAAGEQLAAIDPGPAIGDVGESIDKNVIQPMANDPVGSIATIAAIATQQYYLVPYIAAANTALKGGRIEDIALSFGVAYAAAAIAPGVSQGISGFTGSTVAAAVGTGATIGAGGGAAMALLKGQDVGEAAMRGAIIGGVAGGVSAGYAAGKEYLFGNPPPPIAPLGTAREFGLDPNTVGTGTGEFGLKATMPNAQPFSTVDTPTPTYEFGIKAPTSYASTPLYANYTNLPATELGIMTPAKKFGLDPDKVGRSEFGLDPESTAKFGELNYSTEALPEQYVLGSATNPLEDVAKKTASKYLSSSILKGIYGDAAEDDGSITYRLRRKGWSGTDSLDTGVADTSLNLAAVNPDKFELRKYANPEGASTLISFKDDQPQQPIPTGYEEVETIGAAEGGLISTNMVKYSKKPLLAKRKPEVTKKKETPRKGLAARQS